MEVLRRVLGNGQPSFVQNLHDLFGYKNSLISATQTNRIAGQMLTERALLEVDQVLRDTNSPFSQPSWHSIPSDRARNTHLLDVLDAGCADQDGVAVLGAQERVVRDPAERDLGEREAVLLGDLLDRREGLEVRLLPVAGTIGLHAFVSIMEEGEEAEANRPGPCTCLGRSGTRALRCPRESGSDR